LAAKGRRLTLAGRYAAWEFGKTDGEPVVLLHGWNGRGLQLGFFVEPLVAVGHRVIAVDGPSHGETPGGMTGPFDFAKALLEIQRELGPLRAVVGHSMGGASSCIALADGLQTKALVLLGAPSDLSEVLDRFAAWIGLTERLRLAFREEMRRRTGKEVSATRLTDAASGFGGQVLIVHDVEDEDVPVENGRRAARAFPHATYSEVKVGGHRKMLKDEAVVAEVASFLW
jgi:pimeloyl-ACP methyl ester carboxylesterase